MESCFGMRWETGLEERDQLNTLCSLHVRAGTHKEAKS